VARVTASVLRLELLGFYTEADRRLVIEQARRSDVQ
jgi:hypothetical protein